MRARATSVQGTRRRILLAVRALAEETFDFDPTLQAVSARAGVSVQTLLRHFGSRDRLFDAAVEAASADTVEEREAPVGDLDAAVRIIVDHYELRGEFVLGMLAREPADERIHRVVEPGRRLHRDWVSTVFAPYLTGLPAPEQEALTDLIVVATDVYTWKLLRRDRRLSRARAESRIRQLVGAIITRGETP